VKLNIAPTIAGAWNDCLSLLKKPAWAFVTACILVFSTLVFFGFVNSVSATQFDFSASPLFLCFVKLIFDLYNYSVMQGLLAEGPFLFIIFIAVFGFMIYRIIAVALDSKAQVSREEGHALAHGIKTVIGEAIMTGLYLALLTAVFFILSLAFNVALGVAFFRCLLLSLIAVPVLGAGISSLSRLVKNRFALMGIGAGTVLLLSFFEAASYIPQTSGIWGVCQAIHLVLQWISPVHYWFLGLISASAAALAFQVLLLVILGLLFLAAGNIRAKSGAERKEV